MQLVANQAQFFDRPTFIIHFWKIQFTLFAFFQFEKHKSAFPMSAIQQAWAVPPQK